MNASGQWNDEWATVPGVDSAVDGGIAVAGTLPEHFYMFAIDSSGLLRYAEYDEAWKGTWFDLGGTVTGTPTAFMTQEGRIDVYTSGTDGRVYQRWMHNGNWVAGWFSKSLATSDPTVVSWNNSSLNVIARSPSGTLMNDLFQVYVTEVVVTDFPMPLGKPSAVARQPGTTDIFVTQSDGYVWHGFWPRRPR